MTQPIGYYTGTHPGDGSFLDELQNEYGSRFENMDLETKWLIIWLISRSRLPIITGDVSKLIAMTSTIIKEYQANIIDEVYKLDESTQNSLITALIAQISGGVYKKIEA